MVGSLPTRLASTRLPSGKLDQEAILPGGPYHVSIRDNEGLIGSGLAVLFNLPDNAGAYTPFTHLYLDDTFPQLNIDGLESSRELNSSWELNWNGHISYSVLLALANRDGEVLRLTAA